MTRFKAAVYLDKFLKHLGSPSITFLAREPINNAAVASSSFTALVAFTDFFLSLLVSTAWISKLVTSHWSSKGTS